MRRVIAAGFAALVGCLLLVPASASATSIHIDSIIFQQDGSVLHPEVYAATADFFLVGNTLTVILSNTSTGLSGGLAATNLLVGLGFNLPSGVTIANNGAANSVNLGGSTPINFTAPIADSTWGAANGSISAINNITGALGSVNADITTLQSQMDFDLAGAAPGSVTGPGFGILSASVLSSAIGNNLQAAQSSLTFTLLLSGVSGAVPGDLISQIDRGFVVASFGSPSAPVPEPGTLLLLGTALVGGLGYSLRGRLRRAQPPTQVACAG